MSDLSFGLLRARRLVAMLALAVAVLGCEREERRFEGIPPASSAGAGVVMSELVPGPAARQQPRKGPYRYNAYAIAEGKTLYEAFNCQGCHAMGGGNIGPPLMDDDWIYGSEPENVFATIVEGRPNGMPAFRGKLTTDQVWRLVVYVRSMSALDVPQDARPGRDDHMSAKAPEQMEKPKRPRAAGMPATSQGTR